MKRFLTALLLTGLCACTTNRYTIEGSMPNAQGMVYLLDENTGQPIDSATVEHGSFQLKGTAETPQLGFITMSTTEQAFAEMLFLESGDITIENDGDKIYAIGTPLNDAHTAYLKVNNEFRERFQAPDITPEERVALDDEFSQITRRTFDQNNNNLFGAILLVSQLAYEMSGSEILEAIASFPAPLQQHKLLVNLRESAEAKLRTEVGQPYIDIVQNTPDGKALSLKSVIENPANKYVLIDFWASWCMPCMAEVPYLKDAYKSYHKRGFEIYGVSFDNDKERWTAAIKNKDLNWIHVSDLSRFSNQAAEEYAVRSIPSNFLIDCATGKIIAVNLRGEALVEKISELL